MTDIIPSNASERLGKRIADLRARRGMSKAKLARRARVSERTILRLERYGSGYNPSLHTIELFAQALDVTIVDLFAERLPWRVRKRRHAWRR